MIEVSPGYRVRASSLVFKNIDGFVDYLFFHLESNYHLEENKRIMILKAMAKKYVGIYNSGIINKEISGDPLDLMQFYKTLYEKYMRRIELKKIVNTIKQKNLEYAIN